VDWDQDGKLDILSGCYWTDNEDGAHLQILMGRGQLDFAPAVSLQNMAGEPIQNAIATEGSQVDLEVICTEQHAVDYDDDGDLDLVVGCFGNKFFLFENKAEQTQGKNSIVEQAVALPIQSTSHHAAPHLVDWDNDGDLDLLSGTSDGGVIISINTGTRQTPEWSDFQQLVEPSNRQEQTAIDKEGIELGPATRVWATDWNGDGWQDLVIGDRTAIVSPAKGTDVDQWQQRRAADDKKLAALMEEMQPMMTKYQEAAEKGEELPADLEERMGKLNEKAMEVYESRQKYQVAKSTGHVWLLIRKPDDAPQASIAQNE
jgi:hypothetical protein